jgi:hypothetical protein
LELDHFFPDLRDILADVGSGGGSLGPLRTLGVLLLFFLDEPPLDIIHALL